MAVNPEFADPRYPDLSDDEIQHFIDSNTWIFAKTAVDNPHEYALRKKCPDDDLFNRFVIHIRHNGYRKPYGRRIYLCFDFGPHYYWTMGAPLDTTILINRGLIPPF